MTNSSSNKFKCNFCSSCDGFGCIGELPGLGGVYESKNFQLNCESWKKYHHLVKKAELPSDLKSVLRCGPVTGAQENIGFAQEGDFYLPYFQACKNSGIGICVGDGYPDEKLNFGIEAVKKLGVKAAFFLKPYPQEILIERIKKVAPYAEYIGIDIDSYNILTMRNLVHLEKKTPQQLKELRSHFDVPFVIKGVFTKEDLELVKNVSPDVAYISNHGGRIETEVGSTADFLYENAAELKKSVREIWVDGGIRSCDDVKTACAMGASRVIAARPFISALCLGGVSQMETVISSFFCSETTK